MKILKTIINNLPKILLSVFLTGVISPLIILCFFNQPSAADDFCFASDRKESNYIDIQKKYYNNWSFRYSEGLLHYLNPMIYWENINLYKIITPIFLIILLYSFYFLIKTLFHFNKLKNLSLALIFFIFYLSFMPSIMQGVYWFSGSFAIYQTGIILLIFLISFFIKIIRNENKITNILISSIILVVLAGINEVFIFTILPLIFFIFIYFFIKNDNKKWIFLYLFSLFFIFSTFSITAPGNFIRNSMMINSLPIEQQIIQKVFFSLNAIKKHLLEWINIPVITISIFYLIFLIKNKSIEQKYINPLILLLTNLSIFFFGFFIVNWPVIEYRTLNVIYFIFLLSMFFNLYNLSIYLKNKNNIKIINFLNNLKISNIAQIGFITLFISILLLSENNINKAYKDLISRTANKYNLELNSRYKIIKERKNKEVVVRLLENKPESLFYLDIDKDPHDWKNVCYARYFNLKSIRSAEIK